MTLTARQQYCLDSMGIDIWQHRDTLEASGPAASRVRGESSLIILSPIAESFSGIVLISDWIAGADPVSLDGEAGALLDAMLKAIGLARENIEIAAIVSDATGTVKPADLMSDTRRRCVLYMTTPDKVVTVAASKRFGSLPLIATLHPAHLLAEPDDKRRAWEDLKRLRTMLES